MNICRRFNMRKNDATSSVRRWGWLSRVAELVTWSSLSIFEDKICKFHGQAVDHNGEYTVCICMHHFIWMEVPGVSAFWVWHSLETSCGRDATGGCCVEHQCRNRGSGKKSTLGFGALSLQPWHFWERRPDISHCSQLKDKYVMAKHTHIDTLRHCVWIDMDRNDREPANFPWVLLQKRRSQLLQSPEGPVGMPNGQPFWWRWVDMGNSNSTGFTDFCKTSRGFKLGRLHREWGVGVFFWFQGEVKEAVELIWGKYDIKNSIYDYVWYSMALRTLTLSFVHHKEISNKKMSYLFVQRSYLKIQIQTRASTTWQILTKSKTRQNKSKHASSNRTQQQNVYMEL